LSRRDAERHRQVLKGHAWRHRYGVRRLNGRDPKRHRYVAPSLITKPRPDAYDVIRMVAEAIVIEIVVEAMVMMVVVKVVKENE
jgi:hypothetical protein